MSRSPDRRILLALGCLTAGMLAFEVGLTRAVAIQHWHHLASLIIALAMLGFGCGGVLAASHRHWLSTHVESGFPGLLLLFSLSLPLCLAVSSWPPLNMPALPWSPLRQTLWLGVYALAFVAPFLMTAYLISGCFIRWPRASGRLYASDLLGSALGAALALAVLSQAGLRLLFSLCIVLPLLGVLILRPDRRYGLAVAAAGLLALVVLPEITPHPDKDLPQKQLQRGVSTVASLDTPQARYSVLTGSSLHASPGLSIQARVTPPPMDQLFADGHLLGPLADRATASTLRRTLGAAPFQLIRPRNAVLAGLDGTWWLHTARAEGVQQLTVLEPDAALLDWIRQQGWLPPDVAARPLSLRRFLQQDGELLELVMVQVSVPQAGLAAAVVHHDLTREAMQKLLGRLDRTGIAAFQIPLAPVPSTLPRLLATLTQVLRETGRQPGQHLVVLRDWRTALVMISAAPLDGEALARLRLWAERWRFDRVAEPGLSAQQANRFHRRSPAYYPLVQSILNDPESAIRNYPLRLAPATDDRPFFFHFTRLERLPELREQAGPLGHLYLDWGYLLHWGALAAVVVLATLLVIGPLAVRRIGPGSGLALGYFSLIGVGFMFAEIALLYRALPWLDATTTGFTCIVASLLLGTGIGSALTDRVQPSYRFAASGLLLGGIAISLAGFGAQALLDLVADWPMPARFIAAAVGATALAVPLGLALPTGIRALAETPRAIPWAWASNGFASVLGSVGAVLIAMHWGLSALGLLASGCYALAALVLVRQGAGAGLVPLAQHHEA